jgi:hypothetical protein
MSKLVKRATTPSEGIYYAVPKDRAMTSWDLKAQRADETEEPLHFLFWDYIKDYLQHKLHLSFSELETIEDNYTGLPRGRIMKRSDGIWLIQHGNDTPKEINHLILAEFGLLALYKEGKAKFDFNEHEQMNQKEKKIVWKVIKK